MIFLVILRSVQQGFKMKIKEIQTTESLHNWIKNSSDKIKLRYKINWSIPHSLFNMSCNFFESDAIQGVNFHTIFKSRDVGKWSREQ